MWFADTVTRALGSLAGFALIALLPGCISPELIVSFDTAQLVQQREDVPHNARVQVLDFRGQLQLGGINGREILLTPPAPEITGTIVEMAANETLARLGITDSEDVQCEIHVFRITTPATMLHWDVTAVIELLLRARGQERMVSGTARQRTYIWPSTTLIDQVTSDALRQVDGQTIVAFTQLFAVPAAGSKEAAR